MILLRCPKFLRCLTADAGNFDRGHSLTSLPLPLAALSSLPTSARNKDLLVIRRGDPCGRPPIAPLVTPVGRAALSPPPDTPPHHRGGVRARRPTQVFLHIRRGGRPCPPARGFPLRTDRERVRCRPPDTCKKGGEPPALTHRIIYFVPKIRSPASPRPGTM